MVQFSTNLGIMWVQLYDTAAPVTVANFINYVTSSRYNSTIIHRTTTYNPASFQIIQGGTYTLSGSTIGNVPLDPPIALEANLPHLRGTIAMARQAAPNSATSGFFFNITDNPQLEPDILNPGYAVFGKVIDSHLSVLDSLGAVPRVDASATLGGGFAELPLLQPALAVPNLLVVNSVTIVPEPASSVLGAAGLVAMLSLRRRRRMGS